MLILKETEDGDQSIKDLRVFDFDESVTPPIPIPECILSEYEDVFENLTVRAHIGAILDQITVHITFNTNFVGCFFNGSKVIAELTGE